MPRTPEHRADMAVLAMRRRAAGKPVWAHRIDLHVPFTDDTLHFDQQRDAIVTILRGSRWVTDSPDGSWLRVVIDNLADSDDTDEFNGWFDDLYDLADRDRVWLATAFPLTTGAAS